MRKKIWPEKSFASGYVALISALIISAVIFVIVVSLSFTSFLNRANISNSHFKEKSRSLSYACAQTAFLKLVNNSSYAGNETITVASDTCKIVSVVSSSTGRIISTQAQFKNSYTNFKITVAPNTVSVLNWEEVMSF